MSDLGPKRRPGLQAAHRYLELLAERTGWPDGALDACFDLMRRYPQWHVAWLPESTYPGFERPAGFWAAHDGTYHKVDLLEPDAETLAVRLAEGVPEHEYGLRGCAWCLANLGNRRVRL